MGEPEVPADASKQTLTAASSKGDAQRFMCLIWCILVFSVLFIYDPSVQRFKPPRACPHTLRWRLVRHGRF